MAYDAHHPYRLDPYEPPPDPALSPSKRVGSLAWATLAVSVVFAASGGWFLWDRVIKTDSGVAACEALRDGDKTFAGKAADDKPITEAKYREIRKVFEDSRHEDIRDHGTKLMDLAWQISKMGKDPGLQALAYVGPLTEHVTGLQSACADQGVIVSLPTADGSTVADSSEPDCKTVFVPGRKIDKGFDGKCLNKDGQVWSVFVMDCENGKRLYAVDDVTGAVPGWGYAGGQYRAEDTTKFGSRYSDAMVNC